MGLDITAYGNTKLHPDAKKDADGWVEDYGSYAQPWVHPEFPGRADDIVNKGAYTYETHMSFRAGSYGGYNQWREALAQLAGYPAEDTTEWNGAVRSLHAAACWHGATGPFSELINFADNEGTIGTAVSAKLAKDFADFEAQAMAVGGDGWFYDRYKEWKRAFEMASNAGFVSLH